MKYSWNSNTLSIWCEELTHWKRAWCWERLRTGKEGDDRGWDGWMASPTRWTWVWVDSGSWWWTGRPGVLRFMGLQRVRHDWATELTDWATELTDWLIADLQYCVSFMCTKNDSVIPRYIYTNSFLFFSTIGYYKILNIVPHAIQ